MNNEFNINNFLNFNDLEQKDYILSLDTNEFIKINEIIKKKNFRLSMALSSHRQSNKNMAKTNVINHEIQKTKIYINDILENPEQPRKYFTDNDINEKIESIKARGLITPITILKRNNEYILIAGQIRLESFRRLHNEELKLNLKPDKYKYKYIDVFIKENENYKNSDFAIDSLIENINRTDMHVIDTALALKRAFDSQDLSLRNFSKILGKSEFYLSSYLTIANTDNELIEYIKKKDIKSPTIIYLIIQMNKSIEEKKKLVDMYLNGEIKKAELQEIKKIDNEKNKIKKDIELTIFDNIFSFKKSFNMKSYKELDDENRAIIDIKLNEIKNLQDEISKKMM